MRILGRSASLSMSDELCLAAYADTLSRAESMSRIWEESEKKCRYGISADRKCTLKFAQSTLMGFNCTRPPEKQLSSVPPVLPKVTRSGDLWHNIADAD